MDRRFGSGWKRRWRRLAVLARRTKLMRLIAALALAVFAGAFAVAWLAITRHAGVGGLLPTGLTTTLLLGMMVPGMSLLVLLGRSLALRQAAASGGGRGRLHVQLVLLQSLIAALPTLLMVIFASWLFASGVEFWFSDSSRGLLENANKLAQGYYAQSQRDVGENAVAMAYDLGDAMSRVPIASLAFRVGVRDEVLRRNLDGVAILQRGRDGGLRPLAFVDPARTGNWQRVVPGQLRRLDAGEPVVVSASADRIEALTPIDRRAGLYLYAARTSDLLQLAQGRRAENIVRDYQVLSQRARLLQLRFNVLLLIASLSVVGVAVAFALRLADRQVQPLYALVAATRQVGSGNYALRVAGHLVGRGAGDEIGLLNRAFNRMTAQIAAQTAALVGANHQLDERRGFIEAVLESVTAGVISVDGGGAIRLINSSAQALLVEPAHGPVLGAQLAAVSPVLADLVAAGRQEGVIQTARSGELLTLAVRVSPASDGQVITFEDITRQLLDQRQAAWSDVARRIAHEIKNPLTPIQLATERLRRRYRQQITRDPELFDELTQTIIRQVGDLRKMVDEFSSFARLPKPLFRLEDPVDLTRQALFLQEVARGDIAFVFAAEPGIGQIACDRHQFGQAMTNVLKNAIEAIDARLKLAPGGAAGAVAVAMHAAVGREAVIITVRDNGIGLPAERERITEPYVTTREKGTGLGLAIVKKIVEEHGGDMGFVAAEGGGASVTLRFARDPLGEVAGKVAAQ